MHKIENCKVNEDCTAIRKNESIAAYKQYSKTANHTLTKFTNDMSEILRHSIERLDNISLKVRNCVYELENQKYTAKRTEIEDNINRSDDDDPLLAVIEYKPQESSLLNEAVQASKDAQETVKKAQKIFNGNVIPTKNKQKKTESTISFYTTSSKRDNFTSIDCSMKKERSVMQKIRESYKKLRAKSLTAAEKASCEEQLKLLRREFASQKRRKWLNSKRQRELMVKKGQQVAECYGNERFNDFHWFGPKISVESDGRLTSTSSKRLPSPRNTKLTRKFARENFHEPKGKPQDVKSVKMLTERNDEPVNVIMHTQKQPRYELKQNSPFAASCILDDVTLKDLEPLNAEYPRKDNIFQVDTTEIEETLLFKLVNDDAKALEMLINVNAQSAHKSGRKQRHKRKNLSRPIRSSRFAIDDIPEEEDPKQVHSESVNNVQKDNIIELNDYRSYRNLASKEGRKRLKKYILDPPNIKRSYIVMPVLVQFDKDIAPHLPNNVYKASGTKLKEVERKQKCIFTDATKPGDFLKPYIFDIDSSPTKSNTEQATIMTLTIPNEIPRNVVETIKGRKMSMDVGQTSKTSKTEDSGKGTMLVQKMMSYERASKKTTSPRATLNGKKSDNQQLISFIVNPDKANVVDPLFPGPSPKKKNSPKRTKPKPTPLANDDQRKTTPTMKAINKLEKEVNSSKIDMELTSTTTTTVASHLQSDQEGDEKVHLRHKKRDSKASAQISSKHSIPPKSTPKSTSLNLLEIKGATKQHHHHQEEPKKAADEVAKRILSKWQSLENPSIGDLDNKVKDQEERKNKNYTFIKNPAIVDYENVKNRSNDSKQYKHFSKDLILNASSKEKIHKRQEFHYEYKRKGPDVEIRKVEDEEEDKRKVESAWNNKDLEQFVTQHKAERRIKTEYEIKPLEPKIKLEPKSSRRKMEKVKSIKGIDKLSYALPERPQTAGQVLDTKGMRNDVGLWLEVKKTPKALTDNKAVDAKVSRRFKRDAEVATSLLQIAEEGVDKLAAKKNIEDLEKQLGEETKKFCLEMDQVIKQIQDIPPVVKQQQQTEDLMEILDVCKTKYAAISHSIKHVATIKGVVSVRSFAQYFGPTCDMKRQWSASELVVTGLAEMKNEEVITHTIETVTFPNLQSFTYRDTASAEALDGHLAFRLGEAQENRRDDVVCCRSSTFTRDDLKHLWFLVCVYAMIFALVFSGLNLKLGCD